jgi:hypothetical protein
MENGCEINTLEDNNNCGACGNVCAGGTSCLSGACPVILRVTTTGSETEGDGSAAAPYATPNRAATVAATHPSPTRVSILVAAGTYTATATISLNHNAFMVGGYDGTDWSARDPVANATVINVGSATGGLVSLGSGTTPYAGIDGFTLQPPNPCRANFKCVTASGSPFIRRISCTVHAKYTGSGAINYTGTGSPVIEDNSFRVDDGPSSNGGTTTVYISGGNPTVKRNDIRMLPSYGRYPYAPCVSGIPAGKTAVISHNVLDSGATTAVNGTAGLLVNSSSATATAQITNNTLRFGWANSYDAFGIGPSVTGGTTSMRYIIENNIIWSGPNRSTLTVCIKPSGANIVSLKNNIQFNSQTGFLPGVTTIAGVNSLGGASGNKSFVMVGSNTYFVNDSTDFHLKDVNLADPYSVMVTGGPLERGVPYWDLDRALRTGDGTTGWSVGAYEQDH